MFLRPARQRRRVLAPVSLGVMLVIAFSGPAYADFGASVPADPIVQRCVGRENGVSWRGGEGFYTYYWDPRVTAPHGTMYMCYSTYLLGSKKADGDTYAVWLQSVWHNSGTNWNWMKAIAKQSVTSSAASKDSVYKWTNTYSSNSSCNTSVSVSLNIGIISLSASEAVCSGTAVTLTSAMSTGGIWKTNYAENVRSMESVFVQKVTHGQVPTFTVRWEVPYYTYASAPYPTYWVITPSWDIYQWTATGTV